MPLPVRHAAARPWFLAAGLFALLLAAYLYIHCWRNDPDHPARPAEKNTDAPRTSPTAAMSAPVQKLVPEDLQNDRAASSPEERASRKAGDGSLPQRPTGNTPGLFRALASTIAAILPTTALAGGGPENALVVVNADSWASTFIANEYVAARHIPPANVVRLHNLPDFERMNVEDFRAKILAPVLHAAEQRGLAPQIDYVLYSADFPWAIDVTTDLAGQQMPKAITQPAAINGLTYLYQFTMAKNPGYLGLNVNFYYRPPARTLPEADWSDEDRKLYTETVAALRRAIAEAASAPDKHIPAPPTLSHSASPADSALQPILGKLLALRKRHPASTELLYNLACAHARLGNPTAAVGALREAVDHGWWDMRTAETDPDLASIRGREDFALIAARAKLVKFDLLPTSGFRASVGWLPNGQPVPAAKGMRYMLSTVLACTSGRGNSVTEAVNALQRSIAADGSRPKGTIYFMENRDVRSTTREWGFLRASEKLRGIGIWSSIEQGVLPAKKGDVAGVTIGTSDFAWETSGSKFLPGAIGDNLTSFGGALGENDGQTPITEFIRHGAAGAGGTVTEPFAIQAKFPAPFIHWHYAQGCTLAEAFYQSLAGPYQLLIVGDALCAPWKKELTVLPGDLAPGSILKGKLELSPTTRSSDGIAAGAFELYLDGRRVAGAAAGKPLDFNTADAPDGPHEIVVAANGTDGSVTHSSIRIPVIIRNGTSDIRVTAPPASVPWDKPLTLTASAVGAKSIVFFHDVDEVARIEGTSGTAQIDPRILGQGPVRIQPVAILGDAKQILGEPIIVRIKPPPALPPPSANSRRVYADGFTLTHTGKQSVVQKAAENWLREAGVASGDAFTVEGWFSVAATDVYQFQLHGATNLRLTVDGQPQTWPRGTEWWFVPVHLGAGRHSVKIEGTATDGKFDVRFGGPGSRHLDGAHFQHPNTN